MELWGNKKLDKSICFNYQLSIINCQLLDIDLQLFAEGEKTEKATPKKKQEARKKGQVFQSKELTGAVVLLLLFVSLRIFGGHMYLQLLAFFKRVLLEYALERDVLFTIPMLTRLFVDTLTVIVKVAAPLMGIALITGLFIEYVQVGFLFTVEPIGMKLERLNPFAGFKRIFSMNSAVELVKAVIKLVIVGYVAYTYLLGEVNDISNLMDMSVIGIAVYVGNISINIAVRICAALIVLGIFDYAYQWWEYERNLRMTKQEIREEYKQTEGDPLIKSRIKEKQRQISMRRMMQEVPKADVVITNPTHLAVAIKYDSKTDDAPVVLAKGQDYMAIRIKEVAKEYKVEVVENKPLAKALYESVDIGEKIPVELYQAVAEVLAFVYNLREKKAG